MRWFIVIWERRGGVLMRHETALASRNKSRSKAKETPESIMMELWTSLATRYYDYRHPQSIKDWAMLFCNLCVDKSLL